MSGSYEQTKRHRARNRAAGLCIQCGNPQSDTSHWYCAGCSKLYANKAKKWITKNNDKVKAMANERGRRFPEKRAAHWAVYKAVKKGVLVKPSTCQYCGVEGYLHAHHEDYSKKLEVAWLCQKCHTARHYSKSQSC